MMNEKRVVIDRNELFEKVWSTPISRLAREYELPDVGLAKICKRMEIPRPERGYWQKLEVGMNPANPKLKPLSDHGVNAVEINLNRRSKYPQFPIVEVEKISCPSILEPGN